MRQIFLTTDGVQIEEVPVPKLSDNSVLVSNRYSCISIGTELSSLLSIQEPLIKKILNKPEAIKKVISTFSKTGSIVKNVSTKNWLVATILWFVPLPFIFPLWAILFGFILNFCTIFIIGKMSQRKLNGITGDILGATAFTTELVFLFGLTIYLRLPF